MKYHNHSRKDDYLAQENLKRRQLVDMIASGIRMTVNVTGEYQLGIIDEDDLDVSRGTKGEIKFTDLSPQEESTRDRVRLLESERTNLRKANRKLSEERDSLRKANNTTDQTHVDQLLKKNATITELLAKVDTLEVGRLELTIQVDELTATLDSATKPTEKKPRRKRPPTRTNSVGQELTSKGTPRKHAHRLSKEQVWEIRRHDARKRSYSWIAHRMTLPVQTLAKVIRRETYVDVPPQPEPKPTTVKAGEGVVS